MRIFIAMILSAVIAIPVLATPHGDGSHMLKGLTRQLDLTETQQTQVKEILEAKKPKMDAIRDQMQALKAETDQAIQGVLTKEQAEKFTAMQDKRKEKFENMREHRREKCDKD